MTATSMDRVFLRVEGEEEVTPPYSCKTRSFESLAAAKVLTNNIALGQAMPPPPRPDLPDSPARAAAAAGLLHVQRESSQSTESVVDCLMSLATQSKQEPSPSDVVDSRKRAAPEQQIAARRKLKMRAVGVSSPLARPCSELSAPPRPPPVRLLSGASVEQLKLLAAAYKICPTPTEDQLLAIAERVGIDSDALTVWFHSRKILQDWVQTQPQLSIHDLKAMFYGAAEA
mmetsp:Transcript_43914/g.77406  ORF Transcript_43914/g.77406 Transcript_43914/m.77406 type:complete len:229 (+) Transcript_43914:368-1054(+)